MAARKWYGIQPDSKERKEELENITAFGYQCKLFKDDEKAAYIDRGKHLIPWMGDSSLMIDRYDGRGSLYDLKMYDAEKCPKDEQLTREEIEMEKIIDEERYLELHTDMVEKATYEEEEMKRLNEALQANSYGAVAFNYTAQGQVDDASGSAENGESPGQQVAEEPDEVEEVFEPSPDLQLPGHIIAPKTEKQNAIIEKTASFVAKQGNQMEIVIKTKQKDNAQFDFLNYENILNRYYKHMIKMIKNGRYTPKPQAPKPRRTSQSDGDAYLHPSLRNTAPEPEPQTSESFLASIRSKLPAGQIANTAYAKLLNNMRRHTSSRSNSPAPQPQAHQGAQPVVSAAYGGAVVGTEVAAQQYAENSGVYGYNSQQPPVPGMEPVQLPPPSAVDEEDPLPPGTETQPAMVQGPLPQPAEAAAHGAHMPPPAPVAAAAQGHMHAATDQYSPDIYGPAAHGPSSRIPAPPPPDVQPIIDKMANYVARNGLEFEVTVRNKNDPRFEFLQDWHAHYAYYVMKKDQIKAELDAEKERQQQQQQNRSVSFSIKTKEAEASSMGKGALMGGDSDSDEATDEYGNKMSNDTNSDGVAVTTGQVQLVDYPISKPKPPQAVPSVTAEEAFKNRLAAAAREKLATASKEDHVKAERKRKAAMFAAMLKGGGAVAAASSSTPQQPAAVTTVQQALPPPTLIPAVQQLPETRLLLTEHAPVQGPSLPPALGVPLSATSSSVRSRSPSPSRHRSTPSRSSRARRSRSRSRSISRRSKYRSRSRSYSPRRSHRRSRTPPSGYTKRMPSPSRSRSSPHRSKRSKRSRSRSRSRRSRSRSRGSISKARRSRSRSRTRSHKSSHKPSKKHRHRSRSRSKSRSKNQRKRSRSRSHSRKRSRRSRSRSRTKKSKGDRDEKSSKSTSKPQKSPKPITQSSTTEVEGSTEDGEDRKESTSTKSVKVSNSTETTGSSSSAASSPERKPIKCEKSDSESETERLRQAALDSEAANLRRKALATNGMHLKIKEEIKEEIEDGEVTDKLTPELAAVKNEAVEAEAT